MRERSKELFKAASKLSPEGRDLLLTFLLVSGRAHDNPRVKRLTRQLVRVLRSDDAEQILQWLRRMLPVLESVAGKTKAR